MRIVSNGPLSLFLIYLSFSQSCLLPCVRYCSPTTKPLLLYPGPEPAACSTVHTEHIVCEKTTRGCTLSLALAHVGRHRNDVVDCRQTLFSPGAPVGVVGGCTTFVGVCVLDEGGCASSRSKLCARGSKQRRPTISGD